MKKIFLLLVVLITGNVFSQSIIVTPSDATTYSVPNLVNNVLINTPCVTASNITWRTGTSFGSTNGIGYFTNSNPNFPMGKGVILSTGDVNQAGGPNTTDQSNGNASWVGDVSLETTLAAAGITMVSTNATVLEFEFVPVSPNFSFKFLFASEEYGNSQCQFSDAFAFLLTNLTAATPPINLAKVPGTSTPISVVTIRDYAYNSACPSVNSQYFGLFNGGANSSNAPTNFNGHTVLMSTDPITLIPGDTYKIKLVIADRANSGFDSAIFLAADSFNIGQEVLGPDLTIANNTAICPNQTTTLNTNLSATDYTFVWSNSTGVILGETGSTLTVSTPETYSVTCTNIATPCKVITDSINVQYRPLLAIPNPKNIYLCDNSSPTYLYDLSYNTPVVTNGLPGATVSYHISQSDADSNSNPLPLSYNSAPNTTIYVRVNNPTDGCYRIRTFQLLTSPPPIATTISAYHKCAIALQPTKAIFNLATDITPLILAGQTPPATQYIVKYYADLASANAGTPAISNNYTSITTTIYARIQSISDSSCYTTTPVNLVVDPIPAVTDLEDITTCNSYTLQPITNGSYYSGAGGTGVQMNAGDVITATQTIFIYSIGTGATACPNETSFKITIVKLSDLTIASGTYCNNYILPSLEYGEYRNAPSGGGTIIPPGTSLTTTQTVYFYYSTLLPIPCTVEGPFNITITTTQAVQILPNVFECTSYTLQALTFGNYYNGDNGTGGIIPAGTAISTTKTIYIYGLSGTCPSKSQFEVIIGTNSFPDDIAVCSSYTLPTLTVGNYYTGPNGTGTQLNPAVPINAQGNNVIYIFVANTTSFPNCTANYNFTVTITLPPLIAPTIPSTICDTFTLPTPAVGNYFTESHYVNPTGGTQLSNNEVLTSSTNPQKIFLYMNNGSGCENEVSFDVLVNRTPIVDNRGNVEGCNSYQLTPLINGNYYSGPGGTGTAYNAGDLITTPGANTIYIYANNNGCSAQSSFVVTIYNVLVTQPNPVEECDSYTLPALTGTQKYYTMSGGPTVLGNIQRLPGYSVTTTQTLYIYDESPTRNWCFDEKPLSITIHNTPVLAPVVNINTCNSYTLPTLTVGKYYTAAHNLTDGSGGGTEITNLTLDTSQTVYVYAESGTSPKNCRVESSFTVNIYNVDELADVSRCINTPYVLPTLTAIGANYYNGALGTGGTIAAGTPISTTKTIYIRGNSGAPSNCFDESDFTVTISQLPVINTIPSTMTTLCDDDGTNDGVRSFDLTTLTNTILGTQLPTDFSVTYYATQYDADNNGTPITSTIEAVAYVKVVNLLLQTCSVTSQINIIVNRIPEPTPQEGLFVCINSLTNQLIMPVTLNSGLNSSTHTFEWFNSTSTTNIGTSSTLLVTTPDIYSVIATNIATGCPSKKVSVTVNRSEAPTVSYTVNEDFSEAPVLTIIATGYGGDYEYQLDGGPFQDSPTFYNAVSGTHEMTVRDKNGCGEATVEVTVINFQRFFTPNDDGSNDIWNISDLLDNRASILIYDRYGKFITQIKPSEKGWDGSSNGKMLPADDYWFIAKYIKNGVNKEFKSHFSLKR